MSDREHKLLIIIRGLPGSGKSTLALQLMDGWDIGGEKYAWFEADHYFEEPGQDGPVYRFAKEQVPQAHKWCQENIEAAMRASIPNIVVSNTSTTKKEYMPYIEMAKECGYKVQVIDLYGDFGNTHNVPQEVISRMKARWEPFDRSILL